jgi:hypothetical protein
MEFCLSDGGEQPETTSSGGAGGFLRLGPLNKMLKPLNPNVVHVTMITTIVIVQIMT